VFFLKLIATVALIFVTACHSSPKEQSIITEPDIIQGETDDKLPTQQVVDDVLQTAITPEILYLILTAETALQREQYNVALAAYLKVAKQVDNIKILEKTAKIALFLEDLDKTEEAVSLWLAVDSNNLTARKVALTVALNKKNEATAIEHLAVIFKLDPADFSELLLDIQQALKTEEEVAFSERLLNSLEIQYPQQATIFLSQSILAIRQQKLEQARKKIRQALDLQPKWKRAIDLEAELLLYSGKKAFKDKDYPQALVFFKKITHEKLKLNAEMGIISVLFKQKKLSEAENALIKLLTAYPKQKNRILLMQAEIENEQGNYQRAFDILTQGLNESPMNYEILYSRSLVAEKLDDLVTLEADLHKILQQDPNDAAALNALGYTLADKTTRYSEAEKYLTKALELQPDEAVIIDSYGWLKFKQGDLPAALKYLQQARDKMTGENEIVVHLAEVLWELNRKSKARELIEAEMQKTPNDTYLLEFKTRILDKE